MSVDLHCTVQVICHGPSQQAGVATPSSQGSACSSTLVGTPRCVHCPPPPQLSSEKDVEIQGLKEAAHREQLRLRAEADAHARELQAQIGALQVGRCSACQRVARARGGGVPSWFLWGGGGGSEHRRGVWRGWRAWAGQ